MNPKGMRGVEDRPRLRPLDAFPVEVQGRKMVYLRDPEGFSEQTLAVPYNAYFLLMHFDGDHSIVDLQEAYAKRFNGVLVTAQEIEQLTQRLDEALLLENDRFAAARSEREDAFRAAPSRAAIHSGASYPDEPAALRQTIEGFFDSEEGPGPPEGRNGGEVLKGVVAPHIDFGRGGPCFAWAYKAVADSPPPDVFVVLGTGHSARCPFVLTGKDYETPFGPVRADVELVEGLARETEQDLFEDEFVHRGEHSIEFQTVFLKYLYPDSEVSIVPILCGSFHGLVPDGGSPKDSPVVSGFIDALRRAVEASGKRVCFVAGVDLSHVGARFGDPDPLTDGFIAEVERVDREVLEAVENLDPEALHRVTYGQGDRTRICGASSLYTLLQTIQAERAELLRYDRTIDGEAQSLVSFASMALY